MRKKKKVPFTNDVNGLEAKVLRELDDRAAHSTIGSILDDDIIRFDPDEI
jgi:hypothetical protein